MLYNYNNMTVTIITYYNYTSLSTSWFKWASESQNFQWAHNRCYHRCYRSVGQVPHASLICLILFGSTWHGTHGPMGKCACQAFQQGMNMEYDWIWLNMIEYGMHMHHWLGSILVWSSHMHRTSSHSINDGDHDGSNHDGHGHDALDLVFEWCFSRRHTKWQDPNVSINYQYLSIYHHICSHLDSHLSLFASKLCCRK